MLGVGCMDTLPHLWKECRPTTKPQTVVNTRNAKRNAGLDTQCSDHRGLAVDVRMCTAKKDLFKFSGTSAIELQNRNRTYNYNHRIRTPTPHPPEAD